MTNTHDGSADESAPGIEPEGITRWLSERVPDLVPPLQFTLVAGGRSNLTYRVSDVSGRAWALRRPPVAHVLPSAHDMAREHKILSALGPTDVPVPAVVGLCQDPDVTGASFYVMEFVEGHIIREATTGEKLIDASIRPEVSRHLVDTLAALHSVDVDAAGLGDLAKREDYIARQLRRWSGQFEQTSAAGVAEPGLVERVGAALSAAIPEQSGAAIVHGDYRLDNVVVRDDGSVAAVLDWELCTLGEPLADLGTFLDYWTVPDGRPVVDKLPASVLPGFWTAEELVARYAEVSGRDVSQIGYFRAFGYWRLACILQGVYARYQGGAAAGDPASVDHFPTTIARLASLAEATLEGGVSDGPTYQMRREPVLDTPVLVVAMEGWVDAGLGAQTAVQQLIESPPSEELVLFDGDRFLDLRARRPVVRIIDGVTTDLQWPKTEIRHGHDQAGADILFLVGPEPDYHWQEFVDAVVALALRFGVRMVVGLGAFPAPAPHTRPVRLAATAPQASAELVSQVGVVQGELEVPAGVLSALELGMGAAQIPTISLWARVPHYVSAMPFPMASAALVDGLASISGLMLDATPLRAAGDSARDRIDDLVASNPDHRSMVRTLEEAIDASEGNPLGLDEMPSGDELAAELERFLRGEGE